MQPVEIITIIAASLIVAFTIGYAVYRKVKRKSGCGCAGAGKTSCGGGCAGCSGCGKSGAEKDR